MKKLIALLTMAVVTSAFAGESCEPEFVCENVGKDEYALRDIQVINDEGQEFCTIVTVANFGFNKALCQATADQLNSRAQ